MQNYKIAAAQGGRSGVLYRKIYNILGFWDLGVFLVNFGLTIVSQRSRRHLKTFLVPVAPFCPSISPCRSMATPLRPKMSEHFTPNERSFCKIQRIGNQ